MKFVYKIILEILPSGYFGLPEDKDTIVWPAGNLIIKKLEESKSNIFLKVSKYREHDESIDINYEDVDFKFTIKDNNLIFYCNKKTKSEACEFCQEKVNLIIRICQFKQERFFKYRFIEIYYNDNLIELPKSGQLENLYMIVYDLVKLKSSLDYSIERII